MSSRQSSPAGASEQTPLLSNQDETDYDQANGHSSASSTHSTKSKRRWPTIIALSALCIASVLALVFGFATPAIVEEYVKEALSFDIDSVSIVSFTSTGVQARVKGAFWLDSSKVHKKPVRDLGRAATWVAKEVESGESHVEVYLPEYDNALLGTAAMQPIKLNIRDHHRTHLNMLVDLEPGDVDGIRKITHDFMDGKVKELTVKAIASVPVKSGLISIGEQKVTQFMHFAGHSVPSIPKFDLKKLRVAEYGPPAHPNGMKATAQLSFMNDYPVQFDVPPMSFEILLPDCADDYLLFATADTHTIHIMPKQVLNVSATGFMHQLPTSLTSTCPGSSKSPLDYFIASYLGGNQTTVYISGGDQKPETPAWIGKILKDTIIPVPLPAKPFENMIKNFSLADVHFSLPETAEQSPTLTATVKVLVGLPEDMNFDVSVSRVRADGAVFYEGEEMGKLDLSKWQASTSHKVDGDLLVESEVVDAPLQITNDDVFAKVVQKMIFGGKGVHLGVKATVDVDASTALGEFVVSGIPSEGKIFIKPIGTGGFEHKVGGIAVVDTSPTSLTMQAKVIVMNPTDYHANIPFVNISLYANDTRLGYAWGSMKIDPGVNNLEVYASWETGKVPSELLSQYISGYNTTMTLRSHDHSVPGMANPKVEVTVPMPHMFGKFLKDTTMHLLSSTVNFILFSPIPMEISTIHATAYYNETELGVIEWEYPFAVVVGENETPRLPVDWTLPGLGLIRDALGGTLKVDALAHCDVKIGQWRESIWFEGKGLGAHVKL